MSLCASSTLVSAGVIVAGPQFVTHPESVVVCPGEPAVFRATFTADPFHHGEWRLSRPGQAPQLVHRFPYDISSQSATLTIPHFSPADHEGEYRCVLVSSPGEPGIETLSNPATLSSSVADFGFWSVASTRPRCLGCPPPFEGDWIGLRLAEPITFQLGGAESFTTTFYPQDVNQVNSATGGAFDFSVTGRLGDLERDLGTLTFERATGTSTPWTMSVTFGDIRSHRALIQLVNNGTVVREASNVLPTISVPKFPNRVGKLPGQLECFVGGWNNTIDVSLGGQISAVNEIRILAQPVAGFPPVASKETFTMNCRISLNGLPPGQPIIRSLRAGGDYLRCTMGQHIKSAVLTKRTASFNSDLHRWTVGSVSNLPSTFLRLSHDQEGANPATPTPTSLMEYSWGVNNAGTTAWEGVEINGVGPAVSIGGKLKPSAPFTGSNPALAFEVEGRYKDPAGATINGPLGNLQCVRDTSLGGQAVWTCDFSATQATQHRVSILNRLPNGSTTIQGSATLDNLVAIGGPDLTDASRRIEICVRKLANGDWQLYIIIDLSHAFSVGGQTFTGNQINIQPLYRPPSGQGSGKVSMQDFHFVGCAGMGAGKVSFSDLSIMSRTVAVGDSFLSCPEGAGGNADGLVARGNHIPKAILSKRGDYACAIVPTTHGHAINTKGTGAQNNRLIPIPLPPQTIGAVVEGDPAPFISSPHTINSSSSGLRVSVGDLSGDGICDFAADFAECDSWRCQAIGLPNADGNQPTGNVSIGLEAWGIRETNPPSTSQIGQLIIFRDAGTNGDFVLQPDFSTLGATQHTLVLLKNGVVVANLPGRPNSQVCRLNRLPWSWGKLGGATECFVMETSARGWRDEDGDGLEDFILVTPTTGALPVECDEIRVLAGPGGGPQILAKTGAKFRFQGWPSGVGCDGVERLRAIGPDMEPDLIAFSLPSADSEDPNTHSRFSILPEAGSDVCGSPLAGLNITGPCKPPYMCDFLIQALRNGTTSFRVDPPLDGSNGGLVLETEFARNVHFAMRRTDSGIGPDCGVRSTITAKYYDKSSPLLFRRASLTLGRDAGNCTFSSDFSQFTNSGQVEVFSWSWGASNPTSVGSGGLSAGYVGNSPIWPDSVTFMCQAEGFPPPSGNTHRPVDVIIINFPIPTLIQGINGPVEAMGFVLRPSSFLAPMPIGQIEVACAERASFDLRNLAVDLMPPDINTVPQPAIGPLAFRMEWEGFNSQFQICEDRNLFSWSDSSDWQTDATGKRYAVINPAGTTAPRCFYRACCRHKGWDGTIKGVH